MRLRAANRSLLVAIYENTSVGSRACFRRRWLIVFSLDNSRVRPPKIIKPYVISFCRGIVREPELIYVPVSPLNDVPVDDCFTVVPKHAGIYGGSQIIGWAIWEWPRVLIEAEFHCVWRQPDGALLDITPKRVPVPRVLFLHDSSRRYHGRQIDNFRKPLDRDPAIKRFCELASLYHRALNEGDLVDYHGPVTLSGQAVRHEMERQQLQILLIRRYGANSPEP